MCVAISRLLRVCQASAKAAERMAAEVNSVQEARKLAFYLFWNVKEDFDRCVDRTYTHTHTSAIDVNMSHWLISKAMQPVLPKQTQAKSIPIPNKGEGHTENAHTPPLHSNHILPTDLEHFLPPEQIKEAFSMLDIDGDGKVTLYNIRDAVIAVYRQRTNLSATLRDTKTIVGKVEAIIGAIIHLVFCFLYLAIFNVRNCGSLFKWGSLCIHRLTLVAHHM